jgi:hypothetical protein
MGWVSLTTERTVVGGDSGPETGASFENSPLEMYTLTSHYYKMAMEKYCTDLMGLYLLPTSSSGHVTYLFYLGMDAPVVPKEEEAAGEEGEGGAELPRPLASLAHELETRV